MQNSLVVVGSPGWWRQFAPSGPVSPVSPVSPARIVVVFSLVVVPWWCGGDGRVDVEFWTRECGVADWRQCVCVWLGLAPTGTTSWSPYSARRVPVIDKWASESPGAGLVDKIKAGSVGLVGQISGARDFSICFNRGSGDGGGREMRQGDSDVMREGDSDVMAHCDVVILATGFRPTTHEWLSEYAPSGEEDTESRAHARGQRVHRVGFSHGDALLPLRQIGREARLVAARIAPAAL